MELKPYQLYFILKPLLPAEIEFGRHRHNQMLSQHQIVKEQQILYGEPSPELKFLRNINQVAADKLASIPDLENLIVYFTTAQSPRSKQLHDALASKNKVTTELLVSLNAYAGEQIKNYLFVPIAPVILPVRATPGTKTVSKQASQNLIIPRQENNHILNAPYVIPTSARLEKRINSRNKPIFKISAEIYDSEDKSKAAEHYYARQLTATALSTVAKLLGLESIRMYSKKTDYAPKIAHFIDLPKSYLGGIMRNLPDFSRKGATDPSALRIFKGKPTHDLLKDQQNHRQL